MIMNEMVLTVVAKQRWDMKDEATGKQIKGAKIFVESIANDENREGLFPTSFTLDSYDDYTKFPTIPGKYKAEMTMKPGSKGAFIIGNVSEVVAK